MVHTNIYKSRKQKYVQILLRQMCLDIKSDMNIYSISADNINIFYWWFFVLLYPTKLFEVLYLIEFNI